MLDRVIRELFGEKSSIRDVLTEQGLMKVIKEYKRIFTVDVVDEHIKPCLKDVTRILFEQIRRSVTEIMQSESRERKPKRTQGMEL